MWSTRKKRPSYILARAHGKEAPWISSVAAMKYADIFATGSSDGNLNVWNGNVSNSKLSKITSVNMPGFVNGLCFPKSGRFLVAAVGQEHRLGRWWRNSSVRNSIQIVPFPSME